MINRTIHEVLHRLHKAKNGLPALNYTDMWDLLAISASAEKMNTPVIVSSHPMVTNMLGLELCQSMVDAINKKCPVALYHHLDHGDSVEMCKQAVDTGYHSVMIDGSGESLEENIRVTREVVEYAHDKGVLVEAEIGRIKGASAEGDFEGGVYLAETDDAIALAEKSGVDHLAVGIGTAHGFYTEKPHIHFDRLEEIAAAVSIPLVLHGGTGIPDEDLRKAIRGGITKVNIGTIIHSTYLGKLKEELNSAGDDPYTTDIMERVLPEIIDVVCDRIGIISGA
jgi:ketose-bisphosphate aldolase